MSKLRFLSKIEHHWGQVFLFNISRQVRDHCKLEAEGKGYLEHAMAEMNFSARAHDRILKVARTLGDLAGKPIVTGENYLPPAASKIAQETDTD